MTVGGKWLCLASLLVLGTHALPTTPRSATDGPEQPGALDLFPPKLLTFSTMLDHFSFADNRTLSLRVLFYDQLRHNLSSPVLMYCGNEGDIHDFYNATGFMFELAQELQALVVFVEHRYYGESLPFGNSSFTNNNLRFLTIEQAMGDFAVFLSSLPSLFGCSAVCGQQSTFPTCNSVLFGGSYGGMLVAWMRVKYPHLSVGGIASGAPIDLYPGEGKQKWFYNSTIAAFEDYGAVGCGGAIDSALQQVEEQSKTESGLALLTSVFHTCSDMTTDSSSGSKLMLYLKGALATLAMLDYPYPCNFVTPMPANPVAFACKEMLSTNQNLNNGIRNRTRDVTSLVQLKAVVDVFVNSSGQLDCFDLDMEVLTSKNARSQPRKLGDLGNIYLAWNYQACAELILEPLTSNGEGFYPEDDDQIAEVSAWCKQQFNIQPRTEWLQQATGGSSLSFISNLLLIDNDKDPWHTGGTLKPTDPTNTPITIKGTGSVIAFLATGGAHHQDLRFTDPRDSDGVNGARALERLWIRRWLADSC